MDFQFTDLTESMKRDTQATSEVAQSLIKAVLVEFSELNSEAHARAQRAYNEAAKHLLTANAVQQVAFHVVLSQAVGPVYVTIASSLCSIMEKALYADELAELKKTRAAAKFN